MTDRGGWSVTTKSFRTASLFLLGCASLFASPPVLAQSGEGRRRSSMKEKYLRERLTASAVETERAELWTQLYQLGSETHSGVSIADLVVLVPDDYRVSAQEALRHLDVHLGQSLAAIQQENDAADDMLIAQQKLGAFEETLQRICIVFPEHEGLLSREAPALWEEHIVRQLSEEGAAFLDGLLREAGLHSVESLRRSYDAWMIERLRKGRWCLPRSRQAAFDSRAQDIARADAARLDEIGSRIHRLRDVIRNNELWDSPETSLHLRHAAFCRLFPQIEVLRGLSREVRAVQDIWLACESEEVIKLLQTGMDRRAVQRLFERKDTIGRCRWPLEDRVQYRVHPGLRCALYLILISLVMYAYAHSQRSIAWAVFAAILMQLVGLPLIKSPLLCVPALLLSPGWGNTIIGSALFLGVAMALAFFAAGICRGEWPMAKYDFHFNESLRISHFQCGRCGHVFYARSSWCPACNAQFNAESSQLDREITRRREAATKGYVDRPRIIFVYFVAFAMLPLWFICMPRGLVAAGLVNGWGAAGLVIVGGVGAVWVMARMRKLLCRDKITAVSIDL